VTTLVIIVTANHYWLDAVGGLVIFALGAIVGWGIHRWNQDRLDRAWQRDHASPVRSDDANGAEIVAS
jgi:hypothetical protein